MRPKWLLALLIPGALLATAGVRRVYRHAVSDRAEAVAVEFFAAMSRGDLAAASRLGESDAVQGLEDLARRYPGFWGSDLRPLSGSSHYHADTSEVICEFDLQGRDERRRLARVTLGNSDGWKVRRVTLDGARIIPPAGVVELRRAAGLTWKSLTATLVQRNSQPCLLVEGELVFPWEPGNPYPVLERSFAVLQGGSLETRFAFTTPPHFDPRHGARPHFHSILGRTFQRKQILV